MSLGEFPVVNLILQLCRQLAKPVSNSIIEFAKTHPSFREYFLVTPGRYYHWADDMIKLYLKNNGFSVKRKDDRIMKVKEIDDKKATEIGAQLMLETLIFTILATFVVYESSKSAAKSQLLDDARERDFVEIAKRKSDLSRRLEHQAALIQELRSRIHDYTMEVGYSLPRHSETLEDRDSSFPNSE